MKFPSIVHQVYCRAVQPFLLSCAHHKALHSTTQGQNRELRVVPSCLYSATHSLQWQSVYALAPALQKDSNNHLETPQNLPPPDCIDSSFFVLRSSCHPASICMHFKQRYLVCRSIAERTTKNCTFHKKLIYKLFVKKKSYTILASSHLHFSSFKRMTYETSH